MNARVASRSGFTLLEVMIVIGILSFLAAIALPSIQGARIRASRSTCIGNLKTIESAKMQWAMDTRQKVEAVPADDDIFGTAKYVAKKPDCPARGVYELHSVGEISTCSKNSDGHVLP
jgi:prepilin-type N-terminal cleavage/methylation domain-containing protein